MVEEQLAPCPELAKHWEAIDICAFMNLAWSWITLSHPHTLKICASLKGQAGEVRNNECFGDSEDLSDCSQYVKELGRSWRWPPLYPQRMSLLQWRYRKQFRRQRAKFNSCVQIAQVESFLQHWNQSFLIWIAFAWAQYTWPLCMSTLNGENARKGQNGWELLYAKPRQSIKKTETVWGPFLWRPGCSSSTYTRRKTSNANRGRRAYHGSREDFVEIEAWWRRRTDLILSCDRFAARPMQGTSCIYFARRQRYSITIEYILISVGRKVSYCQCFQSIVRILHYRSLWR